MAPKLDVMLEIGNMEPINANSPKTEPPLMYSYKQMKNGQPEHAENSMFILKKAVSKQVLNLTTCTLSSTISMAAPTSISKLLNFLVHIQIL